MFTRVSHFRLPRIFTTAAKVAAALVVTLVTLSGCTVSHDAETEVRISILEAAAKPLGEATVVFTDARGRKIVTGRYRAALSFAPAEDTAPKGDWGAAVRHVRVEAAGFHPAVVEVAVSHQRNRLPVGGHPSWRFRILDRYALTCELLLRPRLAPADAAFYRFALDARSRLRRDAATALGYLHPPPDRPIPPHLHDGALALRGVRAPAAEHFEVWLDELRSVDPGRRRAAVLVLAKYPVERQAQLLQVAGRMRGEDATLQATALELLGELTGLGEAEGERVERLTVALTAPDPALRLLAARGLNKLTKPLPEATFAALRTALADADRDLRRHAALALAARGRADWAREHLLDALADASPFVAFEAAMALVRELKWRDPESGLVTVLAATLADPRREPDHAAAEWALKALRVPPAS